MQTMNVDGNEWIRTIDVRNCIAKKAPDAAKYALDACIATGREPSVAGKRMSNDQTR